jgi:hypothetical protein
MTVPESGDPDKRARDRHAILLGLRVAGAILCGFGLWLALGGSIAGHYGFGGVLVVMGLIDLIVVPKILAHKWRTPR